PCREDAVSLQGAVGPAGDGRGEPGVHELHQDAAVHLSLARQRQGSSHGGSQGHDPTWDPLLWVQPSPGSAPAAPGASGCSLLPGLRTGSSARATAACAQPCCSAHEQTWEHTALQHRSQGDDSLHCPLPAAASWADRDLGHSGASLGQQWSSAPSTDTASSLSSANSCSSEDGLPSSPRRGTKQAPSPLTGKAEGPRCSARHFSKRKLPAFAPEGGERREEPMPPCPMYRLVLARDTGTGKSSFLLHLCTNEFRGDISGTLGVDFQIKQLLVDGEQTILQIWDTAGQER
ncbi:Ras and EF-hand domain-containing protein, partial [Aptenodytes patagonicus]